MSSGKKGVTVNSNSSFKWNHSFKWNPDDVLTTCKAIVKGLDSGFVCWSCACAKKKKQALTVLRRNKIMAVDCFSLFYLGNSQIYWFYVVFRYRVFFSFKHYCSAQFGIILSSTINTIVFSLGMSASEGATSYKRL